MIGSYDAAVIDEERAAHRQAGGPPTDSHHPRVFVSGTPPPKELHEAAEARTANEAELIAVGDSTIEKALDHAIADAAKVTKRFVDAATDELRKPASPPAHTGWSHRP